MANIEVYGFHRLSNIADQPVASNVNLVRTAINQYLAFRNAENQAVLSTFVETSTAVSERYGVSPTLLRLQPLGELGRPRTEQYRETEYSMAWPLQKAGLALGQTYEQRVKMNIRQFAGLIDAVGNADLQWLRDHALAALFYNGSGWFHDDPEDPAGELTIKGLANGDSQLYYIDGTGFATDNHYKPQAGDLVSASDPVQGIIDELREHPSNTGDVIIIGSKTDEAKWKALAKFYAPPNPNLTVGTGVTQFTGSIPAASLGTAIGYHLDDAYLYTWRGVPQNYAIAFTTGSAGKAVRQREHEESLLRGFKPEADREDYPYFETDYVRRAGFGVWNRVGAVVAQFNNGTYAVPTGYDSPMS